MGTIFHQDAPLAADRQAADPQTQPRQAPLRPAPMSLVDMHLHLDRTAAPLELAQSLASAGVGALCVTVSPRDYLYASSALATCENVRVAVGMHPWWIADGSASEKDAGQAVALAQDARFVGEVGLDGTTRHRQNFGLQCRVLRRVLAACATHPLAGRVISLHASAAAAEVLDIAEETEVGADATLIFHWFNGSSEELVRARSVGAFFSVNDRMLKTRRGRAYAKQIPADRLLLETDLPQRFDSPLTTATVKGALECTLAQLAQIRGEAINTLAGRIASTSKMILGL